MSNQLDKILKKSFENAKKKPSDKVWSQIEKELLYKKQKRKIFWMRITAGLALLFGLSSFFYNALQNDTQVASNINHTQSVKEMLVDANDNSENTNSSRDDHSIELNKNTLVSTIDAGNSFATESNLEKRKASTPVDNSDDFVRYANSNKSNSRGRQEGTFEAVLNSDNTPFEKRNETIITLASHSKKLPSKVTLPPNKLASTVVAVSVGFL